MTLAAFVKTHKLRLEVRPHCLAICPMPDSLRAEAFHLSDYLVSASISGPALEFTPRNPESFRIVPGDSYSPHGMGMDRAELRAFLSR